MVSFKSLVISAVVITAPFAAAQVTLTGHLTTIQSPAGPGQATTPAQIQPKPAGLQGLSNTVSNVPVVGSLISGLLTGSNSGVVPPATKPGTPAPVRPAPVPVPAVTAAQVVTTIQFYTTKSYAIYQTTQAITITDVSALLQGKGNIAQLLSLFSQLVASLPSTIAILSRAPRFTAPADVDSIYNAYLGFVNTQTSIVNSLANKASVLKTIGSVPSVIRQSQSLVNTFSTYLSNIIPSRSADVQRTSSSFYVRFQLAIYVYTGTRSKREILQPMRFMPRGTAASA